MPVQLLRLNITPPAGPIPRGRGFYQLEEETFYFPVEYKNHTEKFFSYLESETVSLQFDREGRLIFIESPIPRRQWQINNDLVPPEKAKPADIRFLDFRQPFPPPIIYCDQTRETILFRFGQGVSTHNYYLAENLIAQVNDRNLLMAIWAFDISDDLAGRHIARWRKTVRQKHA
jgi:hypothetical protein